jgi:TM2 domain-containing membrane protein YozV
MPEERFCPHCGRANPIAMPRCINCGQRIGGSGTLLLAENPEESTIHAPWWQSSPGSLMPPPPQVKEEAARAEAARREAERIAEEQRQYEERLRQRAEEAQAKAQKMARPGAAARGTTLTNCWRCGAPMGEAGAVFSFCLRCGADSRENPRVSAAAPTAQEHQHKTNPQVRVRVHTTQQQAAPQQQRHTANPTTAALLSFFVPGVGQMMNGQRGKGILLLLAWVVFHFVVPGVPWFLQIVAQVLAAMDAYRIAERRRAGKPVREEEWDLG